VLLPIKVARGVADGSMSLAFRRWRKQDVQPGATFRTAVGVIRVDAVEPIDPAAITDADAALAGHKNADAVRKRLAGDDTLPTYRVRLSYAGEDPRVALRNDDRLTDVDVSAIDAKLERLDRASSHGAWTMQTLDLIRRHPQVRAPDLAAELSPRGIAYLARTERSG
jgi:hypothetical protein